ncbi:MAG: type III polyketide synthase [Chitinophagaceae bacterium]
MSKIISIGTAVAAYKHKQDDILQFMQQVYALDEQENRKLRFLYHHSGIQTRYSVIPDYSRSLPEWKFYPHTENIEPFPALEQRMAWYHKYAAPLSLNAIRDCIDGKIKTEDITHLITVSCTGMSAPGLELQLMELLDLPRNTYRTSVNFMGCYAAIHALKIADAICKSEANANVLIVCTELCTLHFQREGTMDNIASGLLFSDGSAAVIVSSDNHPLKGLQLNSFYSEVVSKGKKDMAWELSSSGFLMTLSGYVPELIEEDFDKLAANAFAKAGITREQVTRWCIHPGGKKILEAIHKSLRLHNGQLDTCYEVLAEYGNMSSPTILFVLEKLLNTISRQPAQKEVVFGAAFGPGLTMETFVASPSDL